MAHKNDAQILAGETNNGSTLKKVFNKFIQYEEFIEHLF